jgi:hypothetical protein
MAFNKQAFKENLKKTLKNMGDTAQKVLKEVNDPLEKIDKDLKEKLGDLY